MNLVRRDERSNRISSNAVPICIALERIADPVDETTATLPKGWRGRLVNLPPGDTEGVLGLCLDPHDLAIAKYVAGRDKDFLFIRQLVSRGLLDQPRLLKLLAVTPVDESQRERVTARIKLDFESTPS